MDLEEKSYYENAKVGDTVTINGDITSDRNSNVANIIKKVNKDEFQAANDRFYDIYNKITSGDAAKTTEGINRALYIITRTISDVLYFIYGDKAFSEMALKPILDAIFR